MSRPVKVKGVEKQEREREREREREMRIRKEEPGVVLPQYF